MRKLKLKNKDNYKTHTSIIFFTQVLEELLFDHSDDSYKAPALSTPARVSELIRLVIDTKNAGISYENLTPFIEELKWSISREIVLDVGEKSFCINICEQFSSDGAKPDLIISKLKTIRLVFDDYFKKLLSLLKICLLDKDFSKKDVYLLSTQLVSHAEFEGYHRRYISLITKKYLANKLANTEQIDIERTFDNFSSKFDGKVREWEVYVYTDKEVESYTDQSAPFGIVIPTKKIDFPEAIPVSKFNGYSSDDRILIVLGDINAYDADTARNTALDRLEGFLSTIAFCCHDKVINYTEPVLLHDKTTDFLGYC